MATGDDTASDPFPRPSQTRREGIPHVPGTPKSSPCRDRKRTHHRQRTRPDTHRPCSGNQAVNTRHAGIDEKTGQLTDDGDGGPRRLVISSDFYKVYESAGKKADGLVNLYCWAHVRRHFVRAGDASPVQLKY